MSVSPGDRAKSPMDFVDRARHIEKRAYEVVRRWPKSWYYPLGERTLSLASETYELVKRANDIIPGSESEKISRIELLQAAIGANDAFNDKIELAFSLFPICGEKAKCRSEEEREEKSGAILQEFSTLCAAEEDDIKGNLVYTRGIDVKVPIKKRR